MASTGEVACFGKDKYEAFLKALLSTGMTMPKKNVLLSIGSFKEKLEMLPSVQKLHSLGYNIFATAGTADFLQEHGVPVKYLEALEDDDEGKSQKSEYSLNQHIANNLIDLYINLPSKNRYRRPASYMSKGYRSRRMAVDFAIPLVTNVKCAKLFVEALARKPNFAISSVDYKTSHQTVVLPGLIDCHAFVPTIVTPNSTDIAEVTEASLLSGFTLVQLMPTGKEASIEDQLSLEIAQANAGAANCDYTLAISATADNATRLSPELILAARALHIPFDTLSSTSNKVSAIAAHFSAWPLNKPIVTDAKSTDLASVLLLASLHGRSVHVTNVQTQDDISLISMSKDKELKVTCDVSVYSLFFTREEYNGAKCLPTAQDQAALWENLDIIDTFSVGSLPYQLATELGHPYAAAAGHDESIHLLLSAVNDGRLTLDDLTARLSDNPRAIFDLPVQANTYVEVEIDRSSVIPKKAYWSPLENQSVAGSVHRVVYLGVTVVLDGKFFSTFPTAGRDVSGFAATIKTERKQARFSISSASTSRPSMASLGFPAKNYETALVPSSSSMAASNLRSPKIGSKSPRLDGIESTLAPSIMTLATTPVTLPTTLSSVSNSNYSRRHILSVRAFSRDDLHVLFGVASEMRTLVERNIPIEILKGKVLCTIFFEPSTRTCCSFEAAMNRLGGTIIRVTPENSSATKGESLADTIRTLGCYGDAIVLRHPAAGSSQTAAKYSPVPIINAGDGVGEHPTQVSFFFLLFSIWGGETDSIGF